MKAKAASKSTNWNLRMMASRFSASFQSGRRLSAVLSSSIGSLAMQNLQRIFLLDGIDAAAAGEAAGIKLERANLEFGAGVKRIVGKPLDHFARLGMPQPRQGHMGREFVRVLRLSDAADGIVHLALEMRQGFVRTRPNP